jgi:hypothetical protein
MASNGPLDERLGMQTALLKLHCQEFASFDAAVPFSAVASQRRGDFRLPFVRDDVAKTGRTIVPSVGLRSGPGPTSWCFDLAMV